MKLTIYQCNKNMMKVAGVLVAFCTTIVMGCEKQPLERVADYPCTCKELHAAIVVTEEIIAMEDIGKRYEVETHHYYPPVKDSEGRESRWEVMVGYPKQYLREGEPTDTSISNKTCFCGGPWEFTTNGYFNCKSVTSRTGMNCVECGGARWSTNVTIFVGTKEGAR